MSREPLYAIVYTATGLEIVEAAAVSRKTALYKRGHAEKLFAAITKDPVAVVVREFGPGAEAA